jgi:hypothetical protein
MSGALHGLFVVGAALMLRSDKERGFAWLLLAGLVLKIGWEQSGGVSPSSDWIGGAIVVDAHLYGAAGGLLTVAALGAGRRLVQKRKGPPGGGP